MDPRVAVVGGGVAGLHAAHLLASRGARVVLLEKRSTLGGKVRTTRGDGAFAEAGPWRMLSTQSTLRGLLASLGVATEPFDEDNPAAPTLVRGRLGVRRDLCVGTLVDAGVVSGEALRLSGLPRGASWDDVMRRCLGPSVDVPAEFGDMPAADYLTRPAAPEARALGGIACEVLKIQRGLTYRSMTVSRMRRLLNSPWNAAGVRSYVTTHGLDRFIEKLGARAAAAGTVDIRRMCMVERVRRHKGGGVSLDCRAAGRRLSVDAAAVVLACHALQKLHFDPPLDRPLTAALEALQPMDVLKALLRFRRQFWAEPPYNVTSGGIAQLDGLEVNKVYYPNQQPGPEGFLTVYVLHTEQVRSLQRKYTHAQRVELYLSAVESLHPAVDVRGMFIDVEENWWFGPWASVGNPELEEAIAGGGDRGGVFISGRQRAWMDEALGDVAAAAERAARFLRLPPAGGAPAPGGKL